MYAIYANVSLPKNTAFYQELIQRLDAEDVKPQIYQLLLTSGRLMETPAFFRVDLAYSRTKAFCQNMYVKTQTQRILRIFEEAKIEVICLKGTRFAERFFGHWAARATSDVDLFLPRSVITKARDLLKMLGYESVMDQMPNHYHEQFAKVRDPSSCSFMVELHFDLIKPGTAGIHLDSLWHQARCIEGYSFIKELSLQHTFYATCIHAANHSLNHLKHRLDIIHLLTEQYNNQVDLLQLLRQSERDETVCLVGMVLTSIYEEFPFLESIHPLPLALRVRITRRRLRMHVAFQFLILDGWKRRWKFLMRWLVPTKLQACYWTGIHSPESKSRLQIYATFYELRWKQFWQAQAAKGSGHVKTGVEHD